MNEQTRAGIGEIMDFTAQTWKGIAISVGYIAGIFDFLKPNEVVTMKEIARKKGYSPEKLLRWFRFAEYCGIVDLEGDTVVLTEKGALYSSVSELKDVLAFLQMSEYFIRAAAEAPNSFKDGNSLEKLSEGKISQFYQPRVSDNLSASLNEQFGRFDVLPGDSFLDIGCGNGSFLRMLNRQRPDLAYAGIDSNLFAIEKAKKENLDLGLSDKIRMLVGEVPDDLIDMPDKSYDWVSAINLLYFIEPEKRDPLLEHIVRIARKGVFVNFVTADASLINMTGNPLLSLLWNDFEGFCEKGEADRRIALIRDRFPDHQVFTDAVMQGNSLLVSVIRK